MSTPDNTPETETDHQHEQAAVPDDAVEHAPASDEAAENGAPSPAAEAVAADAGPSDAPAEEARAGEAVADEEPPTGDAVTNEETPTGDAVTNDDTPTGDAVTNEETSTGDAVTNDDTPTVDAVTNEETSTGDAVTDDAVPDDASAAATVPDDATAAGAVSGETPEAAASSGDDTATGVPTDDAAASETAAGEQAQEPVVEPVTPGDAVVDGAGASDDTASHDPASGDAAQTDAVAGEAPAARIPLPAPPAKPLPAAAADAAEWGRVEDGVVSVRDGDQWRVVGEYPDGTPDEALAYFSRKYADLEFKVSTLEQRHARGGASASELRTQAGRLQQDLDGAAVVGDLVTLQGRVNALLGTLAEATQAEQAAHRAAVDQAVVERTEIVDRVEALAARDPQSVQWKQVSADLNDLFAAWQTHQQTAPRLPKAQAQALWKRFRDARSTIERNRRAFFAELDEVHKSARDTKSRLVARAEALAPQGEDGIPAYRSLLDEWKRSGRAGRKADDALWDRFKAAGDALYQARSHREAEQKAESAPRIEEREALLVEAQVVGKTTDLSEARRLLTGIQRRWDEVGRITPREAERALDDRLRRIEQELKQREDADWKRNNPETKARANDLGGQLREAIERLEAELADAEASGDRRAISDAQEALDARRAWLRAIGG